MAWRIDLLGAGHRIFLMVRKTKNPVFSEFLGKESEWSTATM